MEIRYTFHAEEQVSERKIHKLWIEETIGSPDKTTKEDDKYYVTKKLNGKILRVVYVK
ncbi:MAG TPA: DUF4258 domain-containing protein [Candidatus Nanoarchaeia archaeon]|nr:DUF4258 domain-containing protein [Candidatus Nanoarchaeia archaeon]